MLLLGSSNAWAFYTARDLVELALLWGVGFAALAIHYVRVRRRNRVWRERWEQRHGKSLEALRSKKEHGLRLARIVRWIVLAVFVIDLGATVTPILGMSEGWLPLPLFVTEAWVFANFLVLLTLVGVIATAELLKFELKRIDELLADTNPMPGRPRQ